MNTNHRSRESTTRDQSPAPEALRRRIRRRGAEIKRRELETAVRRLEAAGSLSDTERAIVAGMADRIVAELLAGPAATTADADPEDLAALARLFAPPEE